MQDERDQREATASVLACLDELGHLFPELGVGAVADQATGALEDPAFVKRVDLRLDLLDPAPETGSESLDIEHGIGIAVEEHQDVPREQRAHVALDETYDVGS